MAGQAGLQVGIFHATVVVFTIGGPGKLGNIFNG